MGWLVLVALTGFAVFAALSATVRVEPEGRAEMGVLLTATMFALLGGPVLLLGYLDLLRPLLLALLSLLASGLLFAASARGRDFRKQLGLTRAASVALLRLPRDAFVLCVRSGSFASLGLLAAVVGIAWSGWLGYLAPAESWDGLFYHQPMVGFALQNAGFRMVDLPPTLVVQAANGYPRLCEAVSLWFVIFTDKTLIEIGNTLAAPGLMLAAFAIMRRYCRDAVTCIGLSATLLLMPAMLSQLRTTMIDVQVVFFVLAAMHFATRKTLRLRDGVLATLCMALLLASKSLALLWVPPLALVALGRLALQHGRSRRTSVLLVAVLGTALLAGVAALTFARNWAHFNNPLWPLSYSNSVLGVKWAGLGTLNELNPRLSFQAWLAQEYHHPSGGVGDIIARDYGYAVAWVIVPLAALALVACAWLAVRGWITRVRDREAESVLLLIALGALFVAFSPDLAVARFNVPAAFIGMVCVAWLAGRPWLQGRFGEGVGAAAVVLCIVPWIWTGYLLGLDLDFKGIVALHQQSASERRSMSFAKFQMSPAVTRLREQELGRGDLVVFTQELAFVGVLWNWEMSNRVAYVEYKEPTQFLKRLGELQPKWVVVGERSAAFRALDSHKQDWELVGPAVRQDKTVAFRRVGPLQVR